ncbi:MAG: HAD-IA family hydrolase, partial [Chloroflexota bacterium]
DMREGQYRTTRALFRRKGTPEPDKAELTTLSRELPELASRECDALFSDVPALLRQLDEAGLILGVISYSLTGVVKALLTPVEGQFKGVIWGTDRAEHFEKDVERYLAAAYSAQVDPERCLIVDDAPMPLLNAQHAGMQTFSVRRDSGLRGLADRWLAQASETTWK